jgi:hypothetical protein
LVECTNGPIFYEEPIVSDNCPNVNYSCTPTNGSLLGLGSHLIVCTATDASGNTNQCTFTVTVQDTIPPVITCPANVTVECGQSTDPASTGMATATDTCDSSPQVTFSDVVAGNCPQIITRTWTAIDSSGNSNSCVQIITVQNTTPPMITCPPDQQLQCGASTDPASTGMATATAACSTNVTITYTDAAAATNCTGKAGINRTWTATDACGITATCVQHLTFVDTTPPVVTVPGGSNLGCNPTNLPTDTSVKAAVAATDNCGTVTVNVSHADVTSGCTVTRTFTVTATDGCGNTSAPQTVIYTWTVDTTPPVVTVPAGGNLGCNPTNLPTVASVKAGVTAADSCSTPVVNVTQAISTNGCAVTSTFTVTATDGCGNTSAPQTVVYTWTADTTPPVITCPSNVTVCVISPCTNTVPASQPVIAAFLQGATATGSCGGAVTITNNAPSSFPLGTNTVTFTATDACGNSASCQANVIVVLQPLKCEPIQTSPFFCQNHFDLFGNSQFATFEGNLTLSDGDQSSDFRTATNAPVAVTVTIGTNSPTVVYCSQVSCTVQSDGCGGEAWEYLSQRPYERLVFRFTDNQKYNALMDTNLPSSAATGFKNVGKLSTVSIGASQTRFFYAFQYATQPITVVVDGIALVSVSNNVAKSTFPISQSGATAQVLFPERLIPGNVIQWYATGNPSLVSSNNLIYTQQASATGNSTATYYNEGGVFEIQVPVANINFKSIDRAACVQFTLGQPGVTAKVGCGSFCQGPFGVVGVCDWQFGACSAFDDEFEQESWQP